MVTEINTSPSSGSGVNTILIVLVLVVILGALFWYFRGGFGSTNPSGNTGEQTPSNLNVDVNLPSGGNPGGTGGNTGGASQPSSSGQ